jgi:hypothetical protein
VGIVNARKKVDIPGKKLISQEKSSIDINKR